MAVLATTGFDISGSASEATFVGNLDLTRTWSDWYGRPIHIGEYVDPAPRRKQGFYAVEWLA